MRRSFRVRHHAELEDSATDPANKKAAFGGLKLYVKDLDSNTLPPFLARLCDPDKPCSFSEEEVLCVFETAAEAHGRNIIPHISQIISTIIEIMSSAPESLHSVGCSNVICTLSRYVIDPLEIEEVKSEIISSLCRSLSNCLMNTKESVSSGSALCITALVQSNNWQFASNELVNDICLKVSGALEEAQCQTVAHLGLVVAMSKQNPLTLEPYGRSLIRSGLQILVGSTKASNSQMIISSIQMIHSIMKSLDVSIISSEISSIIHAMEQLQDDCMPEISTLAFQAAETAKEFGRHEECGYGRKMSQFANYGGRHSRKGSYSHSVMDDMDIKDSGSNESLRYAVQSVHRITDYDSQPSAAQYSGIPGSARARRRLWSNGSEKSHRMSNDDFFHTALPDSHDGVDVMVQPNSAGLVKSVRRCSDVPTRIADPCPMCLTPRATNRCSEISRGGSLSGDVKMQSTPRKQLIQSYNSCSDSKRDGHRLPDNPAPRQTRRSSGQCTDVEVEERNVYRDSIRSTDDEVEERNGNWDSIRCTDGEVEERNGYWDSIQHDNQCHVQNADSSTEELKFPTNSERSDSAGRRSPCAERQAENEKTIRVKKGNTNCSGTPLFLFVCAVVIVALLLAWWKEDREELYVVPT